MNLLLQRIRSAAVVLLVSLAACGGGGDDAGDAGDGNDPVPPLQRNDPVRDWTFSLYSSSATTGVTRSVVTAQDGMATNLAGGYGVARINNP